MSDLVDIAEQKIEAAMQRRLKALPGEIEAIMQAQAAKGELNSGVTLKRVRDLCITNLHAHGETISTEYRWAIQQALLASQTWSERLVSKVSGQFAPLMGVSKENLTKLASLSGSPNLAVQLINEVDSERLVAENNSMLAIRSGFEEKKRWLWRSVAANFWSLIVRFFRSGG